MLTFSQALNSLSHFFFSVISPLPCRKSECISVCVNMYTFTYMCVYGVGDVKGTGEFNHTLTDVCSGIDLRLFCEHCFRPFGKGHKPLYQSDLPSGGSLHRTNTPHPICVCKRVFFWGGSTKVNPLNHSSTHEGNV